MKDSGSCSKMTLSRSCPIGLLLFQISAHTNLSPVPHFPSRARAKFTLCSRRWFVGRITRDIWSAARDLTLLPATTTRNGTLRRKLRAIRYVVDYKETKKSVLRHLRCFLNLLPCFESQREVLARRWWAGGKKSLRATCTFLQLLASGSVFPGERPTSAKRD